MERAFGVLKVKFLCLKHPILLHHRDDIYFIVLACIAMHNMMVKERIDAGEEEAASFYDVAAADAGDQVNGDAVGDEVSQNARGPGAGEYIPGHPTDAAQKMAIVRRRWEELYDREESSRLQTAIMNQLYRDRYGDEAMSSCHEMQDDYDPLSF